MRVARADFPGYFESVALMRDKEPSFSRYPCSIPAIQTLYELPLDPGVTFFVGENGSGKSTLLEAMAVRLGLNPEGGHKTHAFSTYDTHSDLHEFIWLRRPNMAVRTGVVAGEMFFMRAETMYNLASFLEESEALRFRDLHHRSHGEAFLATVEAFRGYGMYLMDEPEAALSPQRQLAFLAKMIDLVREDSQFVIATHSPILLAFPGATIYQFSDSGIEQVALEDTDHYRITRSFLQDPQAFLRHLL